MSVGSVTTTSEQMSVIGYEHDQDPPPKKKEKKKKKMCTWRLCAREEARRQAVNRWARRSIRLALVERGHYGSGVFRAPLALLTRLAG